MKIALVSPLPPPYGGIANWSLIVNEYASRVDDVDLIQINTAPKKRGLDGRTLWDRVVVQGLAMFSHKRQLKAAIKKEKIDVVHITTSGRLAIIRDILLLKVAKKRGVRSVYHIHFGRVPQMVQGATNEWKLMKKALLLSDQVIAIDKSTYNSIKEVLPSVDACYLPNPFDLKRLEAEMEEFGAISEPKKEISYLGWVIKTKGIEELLEGWGEISGKYLDWSLRIVGPYAKEYLQELRQRYPMGQVVFEGEKSHEDAMRIVASSSIFILPSYTEGFPNVILEAMALEKPIIATSVGAIPDMLDGCGTVIPPQSSSAVSSSIEELINSPDVCRELAKKGREKLLVNYTAEKVFSEYESIWSELI